MKVAKQKAVRIGCGAGFWGDSPDGPAQLVRIGDIDYLVLDYLAEVTMSILARMKARKPEMGYATDFVTNVMASLAPEIARKKIRVVVNAGGVNIESCRDALEKVLENAGVKLKIAIVRGDDLSHKVDELRSMDVREMFSDAELPQELSSINAYLGAFPIAAALAEGADIVLTGRVVDSALALGPLIHEFGWLPTDYDQLAAGSLVGHVIECGTQATGGVFTDWREVEGWSNMGFPVAQCYHDGSFEIGKPIGTGGLVTPMTIAEQVVYEVGDPAAYILPDVICDFSHIKLSQIAKDLVRVEGIHGRAPTTTYKVCSTYADGYRSSATMMIGGREAVAKANAVGESILTRCRRLMSEAGYADFTETLVEVLGGESTYGANSRAGDSREVVLKIGVRHDDKKALGIFGREIYPAGTAMAQGLTGFTGGRPVPQPVIRLFSFLLDKDTIPIEFEIGGKVKQISIHSAKDVVNGDSPALNSQTEASEITNAFSGKTVEVPLIAIAHGRSGDKGDNANMGILARHSDYLPFIREQVTPQAVRHYFTHLMTGEVERFDWPGLNGFNYLMHAALGGGGVVSLRNDPQGKAYAQMLLDMFVSVPVEWLQIGGSLQAWSTENNTQ